MRILITGGAGFVGRHFARRLHDGKNNILIVDDLSTGLEMTEWAFQPRSWAIGDTGTLQLCIGDFKKWLYFDHGPFGPTKAPTADQFDLVIHCAAVVGGRLKIEGDPLAVATDLAIDAELLNWIVRAKKMPKLVYFSSSAAYPIELQTQAKNCALAESMLNFNSTKIPMPDFTYGWSKLSGEYLCKIAAEKYGLDVKIFRPFGGYGEDQDMTYPFPSIIKRIIDGHNPVVVWGSGNQARDFIHIDDVVDCVLTTMDRLKPGEVLNIGTGRGVSFRELAEMACNIIGHKAEIVSDTTKPEGVFSRVADPYKMLQMFKPKVSLEEGIRRVADHLIKGLDAH